MCNNCFILYQGHSHAGSVPNYSSNVPGMEGDLAYYPDSRVHPGNRSRHPGTSAPFSDVSYPISSNNPRNVFSGQQSQQSRPIGCGPEVYWIIFILRLTVIC